MAFDVRVESGNQLVVSLGGKTVFDGKISGGKFRLDSKQISAPVTPVFLGYPHGPKTGDRVPAGRRKTYTDVKISSDSTLVLSADVNSSSDGIPCSIDPNPGMIRGSAGETDSLLNHAVFDRTGDWLVDGENASVKRFGAGKFELKVLGKTIHLRFFEDYYRNHLGYFYWDRKKPLWKKPISGWCSWMAHLQDVTEKDVVGAAEFFSKNLLAYGYDTIQIDDGFQRAPQMNPEGFKTDEKVADLWNKPNDKFPSGMDGLAKAIYDRGMTPGVWIGLYLPISPSVPAYVSDKDGKPLRGPWVNYAVNGFDKKSVDAAYLQSILGLKAAGWKYFKIDTLRHVIYDNYRLAPEYWAKRGEDPEAAYRQLVSQVKQAIGKDTYMLACWGTIPELAGIPDGCRIGEDVGPRWHSIELVGKYLAQFNLLNNVVWRNDPDYMCFRASIENCRFWASMIALTGSQLMVSDPISSYDADRVDILRRVGPPVWVRPQNLVPVAPSPEFWTLQCSKNRENWMVAGRFAWNDLGASQTQLSKLGLDESKEYLAFDFWNSKFLGVVKGTVGWDALRQGNCQVVSLRPLLNRPQVLGTDRHIAQGQVELDSVKWAGHELSGTFKGGPGRSWRLFVHVPDGYHLVHSSPVKAGVSGPVATLEFPGSIAATYWNIQFGASK